MSKRKLPPKKYLEECFMYCPLIGQLIWKRRPSYHFTSSQGFSAWNKRFSLKSAGAKSINKNTGKSYIVVGVNGRQIAVHRIIMLFKSGTLPNEVDHIDGDGLNNKMDNLRDVSRVENMRNSRLGANNTSGVVGVGRIRGSSKWYAKITVDKKVIDLGSFYEIEDAAKARKKAEVKYGFHENHGSVRSL